MNDNHNQKVKFTQQILLHLQQNISEAQFEIINLLTIQANYLKNETSVISLDSLYRKFLYESQPFELELKNFTTTVQQTIETMLTNHFTHMRNTIFPTLKHTSYRDVILEQIKELNIWDGDPNKIPLVSKTLTENLIIRYVIHEKNSFRNLSLVELPDYQLNSIDELHALAITNLEQFYTDNQLKYEKLNEGIYQFDGGHNFEASTILLDYIWQNFPVKIKGEIVAFIPAADVIYIVDSHYDEAIKNTKIAVESIVSKVPHPIICEGIVYRQGRWESFKIET